MARSFLVFVSACVIMMIANACVSTGVNAIATSQPTLTEDPAMPPSGPRILIGERWDAEGFETGFPDPYILKVGDYYYIAATITDMPRGRIYRTPDLRAESVEEFKLTFDFGDYGEVAQIWGFVPYQHSDGSWHGYGTLNFQRMGVQLEVAHFVPAPGEAWTDEAPIQHWVYNSTLVGDGRANWNAYESKIVRDDDGSLYLIYNETLDNNIHVMALRLLDPATPDPDFERQIILSPEGYASETVPDAGDFQLTEGTWINKIGSRWVLLYSAGHCCIENRYKLGMAFSETLIPVRGEKYKKILIDDPTDVWGNGENKGGKEILYLLQAEEPDWPNYCGAVVDGPGLGNIVAMPGGDVLTFHGRRAGHDFFYGEGRYVWTLPVTVNISDDVPPSEWIEPDPSIFVASE